MTICIYLELYARKCHKGIATELQFAAIETPVKRLQDFQLPSLEVALYSN